LKNSAIESKENIHRQTDWEWASLDKASVIMFWIPRKLPEMPGFTTNIEFGMFMSSAPEKVILGFPETAEKMRYLDYLYEQIGKRKSVHTLEETIAESLRLWNERNTK